MSMLLANATAVSTATDYYSSSMTLSLDTCVSFQVSWTGNIAGTLYLQVSNDNSNWITTAEVFPANPNNDATTTAEVWSGFGYKYARIKLTKSDADAGTWTVKAFSKRAG